MQKTQGAEGYVRACRAVSAVFTALVLEDPSKWPSVQLPYSVPTKEIERSTAVALYGRIDPSWTLVEDRTFRDAIRTCFRANIERALRTRGRIVLPNKMVFMLMEP